LQEMAGECWLLCRSHPSRLTDTPCSLQDVADPLFHEHIYFLKPYDVERTAAALADSDVLAQKCAVSTTKITVGLFAFASEHEGFWQNTPTSFEANLNYILATCSNLREFRVITDELVLDRKTLSIIRRVTRGQIAVCHTHFANFQEAGTSLSLVEIGRMASLKKLDVHFHDTEIMPLLNFPVTSDPQPKWDLHQLRSFAWWTNVPHDSPDELLAQVEFMSTCRFPRLEHLKITAVAFQVEHAPHLAEFLQHHRHLAKADLFLAEDVLFIVLPHTYAQEAHVRHVPDGIIGLLNPCVHHLDVYISLDPTEAHDLPIVLAMMRDLEERRLCVRDGRSSGSSACNLRSVALAVGDLLWGDESPEAPVGHSNEEQDFTLEVRRLVARLEKLGVPVFDPGDPPPEVALYENWY
jgi:hypothetical protein